MISDNLWQRFDQPLHGKNIILEPLQPEHYNELEAIIDHPDIVFFVVFDLKRWFDWVLDEKYQKQRCTYVVRRKNDQSVVGSTSFSYIHERSRRCCISNTWYSSKVWGTNVNPDCRLTLFKHGFETLGFNRVEIYVEIDNTKAQRSLEKLGIVREGVLRQYVVLGDKPPNDVVSYSVIKPEWPKMKEGLERRLL